MCLNATCFLVHNPSSIARVAQYDGAGVAETAQGASVSRNPWGQLAWLFGRSAGIQVDPDAFNDSARTVLDALSDWICGLDASGRIAFANAAFARDQGQVVDALSGMALADLLPDAAREGVRQALQQVVATGKPQVLHHEVAAANGGPVWRQWTFQRLRGSTPAEPTAACFLATGRDITEQKRLEHQFLHAQRVGTIGMLASGIAHDLNNVLAPIVMSTDLLKLRGGSEENRALLDVVATSAARGAGLVSQMLSFSRGLEDDRQVVDLASLVKELGRFVTRTFSKNIQVSLEVAADLWQLQANSTQIYQVLLNLCVNARDAMPHGGTLAITARNATLDDTAARALPGGAPGKYVVLGVADTGTGIAPEIVDRIFDPFFTTKPIGEGTGLGLSTVRSLVKSCGGFLTFSTQVGRGTEFHVYLPVMAASSESAAGTAMLGNARGVGERVLVIDDEEFFRDVTRRLLEDFGYLVQVSADGAEAVRIFAQPGADFDVALVDLDMPTMDGRTTIQALKALDPQVHIITVSGSGNRDPSVRPEGAEIHLIKPYPMGILLRSLREVLDHPAVASTPSEITP